MKIFSSKIITLGIICRIYLTNAASNSQSAPIISGTRAELGQFPWHVLLAIYATEEEELEVCGGSILSEKWVLTAAHCIHEIQVLVMAFGTIEFDDTPIMINSDDFFIHPEYDDVNLINDIALIELPTPLNFSDNIKTIDLVSSREINNTFIGVQGTICGFGTTSELSKENSEWLLWTTIEIVNNTECDRAYDEQTPATVMCGIGWNATKQSPCVGDSGGALVWKNENDTFIQIGIISYAKRNCSQYPVGYTRVAPFLDFINNITGLNFD
ncbi:collagenase-like [Lucilia sericata]|uniref:collagenase-like n=1 Tax=Lucilia sericata TaxID=13632 RepID=UPI0018A83DD5|nr:collagenase-like [Lucilia sericata]